MSERAISRGAVISHLVGEDRQGRKIMDFRYEDLAAGTFGLGIQRGALFDLLRDADPKTRNVQTSCTIVRVDPDRGYLFSNSGEGHGPFDLIVGADGDESATRQALAPLVYRDRKYPWSALLCLLDDR